MRTPLILAAAGAALALAVDASAATTGPAGGSAPVNDYQPSVVMTQTLVSNGIFPCRDSCGGTAINPMGALRTFSFGFSPGGMPTANGQIMSIAQNTALFSLLGTSYGGNGATTFALPDLTGRSIVGQGAGPGLTPWDVGQQGGQAQLTLTTANLPPHSHSLVSGNTGITGGGQPFDNLQPSLGMTYMIAEGAPFLGAGVTPFLGQVSVFAGNFAPDGWLPADGRLLSIAEHDALWQLIGTTYGGDGQDTFALPDLRGRVAVGATTQQDLGAMGGQEETFLTLSQLPSHDHSLPGGGDTGFTGGNQPFDNTQPFLDLNYLINLQGIFPCRDPGPGCGLDPGAPYLGEMALYAGGLIPNGWALANGQVLSIAQNTALFSLIGTTYGGNGQTTFALPDLRGRTILGSGQGFDVASLWGQSLTTLSLDQMPRHVHSLEDVGGPGIPEPSAWLLMIGGLGLAGAALRRRSPLAA